MEQQNKGSRENGEQRQDSSAQASQRLELEAAIAETQFHDERVEDTEYYTNFLEQIMGLVRNGDQAAVSRMISVIRSGASQEDILKAISEISNNSRDGQEGNRGNS